MNRDLIAGVDIGGTHITAAIVNLHTGTIIPGSETRMAVNSQESPEKIIHSWASCIQSAFKSQSVPAADQRVGIAMPGPVDYENGICFIRDQGKYDQLYGRNIKELLAARLHIQTTDIRMMNDALCFLKGEIAGGAARGVNSALGLTLGTGLGSAWYHNNRVVDADLWQMPYKGSIAEDLLSSRWFVQRYALQSGLEVSNTKSLVELLPEDPSIAEIFEEFSLELADFLEQVLPTHSSEVVVLGGNIARSHHLFLPRLLRALQEKGIYIPVRIAKLGEKAHIVGAAAIWA